MSELLHADAPGTPVKRLWNRNFILLTQGQFVSLVGSQAFLVAVSFWIAEATGSPGLLGTILMIALLPGLLFTPFGGAIADRYSRLGLVIAGDLIRGAAITAVGVIHFSGASVDAKVIAITIAMAVSGLVGAFFQPAITAMIPDLVPPNRLASAHSAGQVSAQVASIIGQAAGGMLYRLLGAPALILLNGIGFFLSAGSETFIRSRVGTTRGAGTERLSAAGEIREGMAWVRDQPGMIEFLLAAAALNFFMAPLIALLPFYVTDQLGADAQWYGFLVASLSGGSILGSILAGLVQLGGQARARALVVLFAAAPLFLSALGTTRLRLVALLLVLSAGACAAFINVNVFAQIQRMTPNALRGRVISLVLLLAGGAAPLGMAAGGLVTQASHGRVSVTFVASGVFAAILGTLLLTRSRPQKFMAEETVRQ